LTAHYNKGRESLMNYDTMTDEQLWQFVWEVANNSVSVEDAKQKVRRINYPLSMPLYLVERSLKRGFRVMLHGHDRLISVE